MKIILCGSISKADEILRVKQELENKGHKVEMPEGVKRAEIRAKVNSSSSEKANIKVKYDLIRGYYEKMKDYDVVLVVNPEKKGINGYIGGNTFIEMAFAHILKKPLYCLYPLPQMDYSAEIIAMQPVVLNGNLKTIKRV